MQQEYKSEFLNGMLEPTPSKGSEANWEDIAQTEGGTGQQPNRAMLEDNPTTSSPLQSKRVTKPVDHLMMAMEKVFEKWLRITKQGPEQKSKGEIFFTKQCSQRIDQTTTTIYHT